jgi:hypothetical protein
MHPHNGTLHSGPVEAEVSLPLQKIGTRAFVEIHTQLESAEPLYPVSTVELWSGSEEFDLCGVTGKTLEKHEFLLHLIMHLSEHHLFGHGLRALLDVHLWIELHHRSLDWNRIVVEATRRGYSHWVYLSLRIAHDALATPVPARVFTGLTTPDQLERMEQLAYEQILAEGRAAGNMPVLLVYALAQPTVSSAARLIRRRLIPSRAGVPPEKLRGAPMPALSGVPLAARRALTDLRTRIPQYYRAWRAGRLRWSSLRRAANLRRSASQLHDLMRAQTPSGDPSG